MRALVCGGRHYYNKIQFRLEMDRIHKETPLTEIIHGGATGADKLAGYWAKGIAGIPVRVFEADWDTFGKSAGPRRNSQMLAEGHPEIVIAFPGGPGTADMVAKAKKAKIPVKEIAPLDDITDLPVSKVPRRTGL